MIPSTVQRSAVAQGLGSVASNVRTAGADCWHVDLRNGKHVPALARLAHGWLSLTAKVRARVNEQASWQLLVRNAGLPSGARLTRAATGQDPTVQLDAWIGDTSDVAERAGRACADLLDACTRLAYGDAAAVCTWRTGTTPPWMPLTEAQPWPLVTINGGQRRLDLEARGERFRVPLSGDDAFMRWSAELLPSNPLCDDSREAIADLLLAATWWLRAVRASVAQGARGAAVVLESVLPAPTASTEVEHAIGAMVTACEQVGREARLLGAAELAAEYLGVGRTGEVSQEDFAQTITQGETHVTR